MNYYDILYGTGESTCFAKHAQGTKVRPVSSHTSAIGWAQYVCLNPLDANIDHNPTEEYHDPARPRRADANVTVFRNILIEMDDIPLLDQLDRAHDWGIDYSACVYSGGKSLHFIISLDEPCKDKEDYDLFVRRLYRAIETKTPDVIDSSVKNASRLTRMPNATRDNGVLQELLVVKDRVNKKSLEKWVYDIIGEEPKMVVFNPLHNIFPRRLSVSTQELLMTGTQEGSRNQQIFKAACDFANCDYNISEAENQLLQVTNLERNEVIRTIKSAYNKVGK